MKLPNQIFFRGDIIEIFVNDAVIKGCVIDVINVDIVTGPIVIYIIYAQNRLVRIAREYDDYENNWRNIGYKVLVDYCVIEEADAAMQ